MIFSKFNRVLKFTQILNNNSSLYLSKRGYCIDYSNRAGVLQINDVDNNSNSNNNNNKNLYIPTKLEREKEKRKDVVREKIKEMPHLKDEIIKIYNDTVAEETKKEINEEITRRNINLMYDSISFEPPQQPLVFLNELLNRIQLNEQLLFNSIELTNLENAKKLFFTEDEIKLLKSNPNNKLTLEKGRDLYLMDEIEDAIELFSSLGNYGMANVFLGNIYYQVERYKDYEKAFKYFQLAAKSKVPVALGMLGEMYLKGYHNIDSRPDEMLARCYFTLAANLGLKSSNEQLVYMLINGVGGEVNLDAAIYYCKKLSLLPSTKKDILNTDAITTLGGLFLDSNLEIAKDLWIFASRMGDPNAMNQLARHYYTREHPDYNNSFSLWSESAKKGNPDAQFHLGVMYDMGFIAERNPTIALQLFEASAKQGNSSAQFVLGESLIKGINGYTDEKMGWHWVEESAKNGDQLAIDFINNQFNQDLEQQQHEQEQLEIEQLMESLNKKDENQAKDK